MRTFVLYIIFSALFLFSGGAFAQDIKLSKPKSPDNAFYSGDKSTYTAGDSTMAQIIIFVDSGKKAKNNIPIRISMISSPEDNKVDTVLFTDSSGNIYYNFDIEDTPGEYLIEVEAANVSSNRLIYTVKSRNSNWVLVLVVSLLGGLSLFLFGMNMMSLGMQKSAGDKMRSILSGLTNNRLIAVGVGAFVTMLIQSSSATSVMLVSFVYSGLMSFVQSLGVILGAGIGTTITAQLIAFKLTDYSLLFCSVGFFMFLLANSENIKNIGKTILGFGLLFFGMDIMSEAMYPLRTYEPFLDLLLHLENPLTGILFGALFTALIQSSSAFIGIVITLSTQGILNLEVGIPLILGANIGTPVTAIIASINTNREAVKVAMSQLLFKLLGVLIFVWWIPTFQELVEYISPKTKDVSDVALVLANDAPRQIANAHTIFNVLITILILPFTKSFARLFDKILPEKESKRMKKFNLSFIDTNKFVTPTLALNLAKNEIKSMSESVMEMIKLIEEPFKKKSIVCVPEIEKLEQEVDFLRDEIKKYLIHLSSEGISHQEQDDAYKMLYVVNELEHIADIVAKGLAKEARKYCNEDSTFSPEGSEELFTHHLRAIKQFSRAIEVFTEVNLEKAKHMKRKISKYRDFSKEIEFKHYRRLINEPDHNLVRSKIHVEVLMYFRAIQEHSTNIAGVFLYNH